MQCADGKDLKLPATMNGSTRLVASFCQSMKNGKTTPERGVSGKTVCQFIAGTMSSDAV